MSERPEFLKLGEPARLIPTVADTSKEGRAVSILLSAMTAVKPFGAELLAPLGQRLGKRTTIEGFREVAFRDDVTNGRPDGLIIVRHGRSTWSALVEGKIGTAKIGDDQIQRYANLAKAHRIDAVISVSNEFASLPDHGPVQLPRALSRHVDLFHWSWMSILTQATLLLSENSFDNNHERLVLNEVVRFLKHKSTGISGYTSMAPEWKEVATRIQTEAPISKNMEIVQQAVSSWHQEERDLCLLLSRKLGRPIEIQMSRKHKGDSLARLADESDNLCQTNQLTSTFHIPDTAAPLNIMMDFKGRSVTCSMQLKAPEDKKRNSSRINWLLRQLKEVDDERIFIRGIWPKRAGDTQFSLKELREDSTVLERGREGLNLLWFDVKMVEVFGSKFSSPRKFIQLIEALVPTYYEKVGEHLRAWVPAPPKLQDNDPVTSDQADNSLQPHTENRADDCMVQTDPTAASDKPSDS